MTHIYLVGGRRAWHTRSECEHNVVACRFALHLVDRVGNQYFWQVCDTISQGVGNDNLLVGGVGNLDYFARGRDTRRVA